MFIIELYIFVKIKKTPDNQLEMVDIYDFYKQMDKHNVMLSFKGQITSELLSSVLQIMENKMEILEEPPKIKKKVYNILVECLQNLYHHLGEEDQKELNIRDLSAIFTVGKENGQYSIHTGNYIANKHVDLLRSRIDKVNGMSRDELKLYYQEVLNNGEMSDKGGGGLGIIDIARKSREKINYEFKKVDSENSFFSLNIKVTQQ